MEIDKNKKRFSTVNFFEKEVKEKEILEKRINEIFENTKMEDEIDMDCPETLRDKGGLIPDWYIIYANAKDINEGIKLVEYSFKEMNKVNNKIYNKVQKQNETLKFKNYKEI
jgi:hypothetical protein